MKRSCHVDVETYSEADLPKVGHYRYAQDPSTRVTLVAWAVDDGPVQQADLYHGDPFPDELLEMMLDPDVVKWAHNAAFERAIFEQVMKIPCPPAQWRCTAVWGRSLALPAGLGQLAKTVGAEIQKMEIDKRLITKLCTPKLGGPERHQQLWTGFMAYNKIDVEAERAIHRKLRPFPMPGFEWKLWELDQEINDRGMPIDLPFVRRAALAAETNANEVVDLVKEQTKMENPASVAQWMSWLRTQEVEMPDMRVATVDAMRRNQDVAAPVRSVLDMRRELASSSTAKFDAIIRAVGTLDRVRGALQFYGAPRTGRWSGKLVQPHNLPRGILKEAEIEGARELVTRNDLTSVRMLWPEVSPVLASLVRTAIAAPRGKKLVSVDLSSIETVKIGWAAGCESILQVFHNNLDVYKDFATRLFGVDYYSVNKAQRGLSKPAVLGCGYGMSWRGLQAYALSFGVILADAEAQRHVQTYRSMYPEVVQLWSDIENAAFMAVENKASERVGPFTFRYRGGFLFIDLPSGRSLAYHKPYIGEGRFGRELRYISGAEYNTEFWLSTYGAKLVENIVQAISRDVLAAGLMRAKAAGLDIVLHVHDEIVVEADENDETALPTLIECMTRPLNWCPGSPIKASGWEGRLYRKD